MYNRTHPHRSANGLHLYPFQLIPSASYAPVAADIVIFSLPQDSSGGGKEGVYLPALRIYVGRYAGTYPAHGHTEAHEEMLSAVSTFHLSPPPPPSFTISPSNVRTYVCAVFRIVGRRKKREEIYIFGSIFRREIRNFWERVDGRNDGREESSPYFYATILLRCMQLYVRTCTGTRDALLLDYIFNPPSPPPAPPPPTLSLAAPLPPRPSSPCPTSYVATTPRRILHFRIPNGITMQEISFVIYARYKRVHFRLG